MRSIVMVEKVVFKRHKICLSTTWYVEVDKPYIVAEWTVT